MPPRRAAPSDSLQEGSSGTPPSSYRGGLSILGSEEAPAFRRASSGGAFEWLPGTFPPTFLTQGEEMSQLWRVLLRDMVAAHFTH